MTSTLDPAARREPDPSGDPIETLGRWTAHLDELADALVRQREAVAADRVADVHASVDDLHRLLQRLEVVMRAGVALAVRPPDAPVEPAVQALRAAAQRVRREASINHEVLQRGLAAGERWLQELFTGLDLPGAYGPAESKAVPGRFMDRRG